MTKPPNRNGISHRYSRYLILHFVILVMSGCVCAITGCGGSGSAATVSTTGTAGGGSSAPSTAGFSVLVSFNGINGAHPSGRLIADSEGNFYGTTQAGGTGNCKAFGYNGCGTVFELSPSSGGQWTERIIYSFQAAGDGVAPHGGVIADAAGNLYGAASQGGGSSNCAEGGCGTIFELSPSSNGQWSDKTLYSFVGGADGVDPMGGLAMDSAGNLYGTTYFGGDPLCGCGTVFELSPTQEGHWTKKVLHVFAGDLKEDGGAPEGRLIFDHSGNLYGTSSGIVEGTGSGPASVFELSPSANGWTYTQVHLFPDSEGSGIKGGVSIDADGDLYGTATLSGPSGYGAVFQLSPANGGTWTESTLYAFAGGPDGIEPRTLLLAADGNIYGATSNGGESGACGVVDNQAVGCGTLFELTKNPSTGWSEKVLYRFMGAADGIGPGDLTEDSKGNLYGTAVLGNAENAGAVFRFGLQ